MGPDRRLRAKTNKGGLPPFPIRSIWSVSSRRLDSLTDLIRHGLELRVECACGRVVIMNSIQLAAQCRARGTPQSLLVLTRHLKCTRCGRRPRACEPM